MLKIRNPNTRAIVSGAISILSLFFWMWLLDVFQDNMTLRQEMIAAKPAVLISIILCVISYFAVAFATKLDGDTIEKLEVEISVSEEEKVIRANLKRMQDILDEIPQTDQIVEKMETIIEVVRETLKALSKTTEAEDMTDAQDLKFLVQDTADGLETYQGRLKRAKLQPDLLSKINEDREKVPTVLLGFLALFNKVSPDVEGNSAFKLALMKMGAWGYTNQLKELDSIRRKNKEGAK